MTTVNIGLQFNIQTPDNPLKGWFVLFIIFWINPMALLFCGNSGYFSGNMAFELDYKYSGREKLIMISNGHWVLIESSASITFSFLESH